MGISRARALQERSWALHAEGRLADAAVACREAIALVDQAHEGGPLDLANLLNDLAEIERDRGSFAEALALVERAGQIGVRREAGPVDDAIRIRLRTLTLTGSLRRAMGTSLAAAWSDLLEAEALAVETFGEASEEGAVACNELGLLCKVIARFDEGARFYERALASMAIIHGDRSPAAGTILHNIGGLLHERGAYSAAEAPSRLAWDISRQHFGPEHPQTMADAVAYAAVLDGLGRHEACERLCRDALVVFERTYGADHDEVAATLHNLGAAVESRGDSREAEACYRRAVAIHEQRRGPGSLEAELARNNLGKLLVETGRTDEGLALLQQCLVVLHARLPAAHPHLARVEANIRAAAHAAEAPRRTALVDPASAAALPNRARRA